MEFRVSGPGENDLRSLVDWLLEEPTVRRAVLSGPPPTPGEQGAVLDVIQVVLGDGVSIASLIVAIKQWQSSRSSAPRIEVEDPDGTRQVVLPAEDQVRGTDR